MKVHLCNHPWSFPHWQEGQVDSTDANFHGSVVTARAQAHRGSSSSRSESSSDTWLPFLSENCEGCHPQVSYWFSSGKLISCRLPTAVIKGHPVASSISNGHRRNGWEKRVGRVSRSLCLLPLMESPGCPQLSISSRSSKGPSTESAVNLQNPMSAFPVHYERVSSCPLMSRGQPAANRYRVCMYPRICAYLYNLWVYSLFLLPALLRLQTALRPSAAS